MPKPSRSIVLASLASLTLVSGCVADDTEEQIELTQDEASSCKLIEAIRFTSVDELTDCGPAPAGSHVTCHWHVSFDVFDPDLQSIEFDSLTADTGESGVAKCLASLGGIELVNQFGEVQGKFDFTTELLTWNDVVYAKKP